MQYWTCDDDSMTFRQSVMSNYTTGGAWPSARSDDAGSLGRRIKFAGRFAAAAASALLPKPANEPPFGKNPAPQPSIRGPGAGDPTPPVPRIPDAVADRGPELWSYSRLAPGRVRWAMLGMDSIESERLPCKPSAVRTVRTGLRRRLRSPFVVALDLDFLVDEKARPPGLWP